MHESLIFRTDAAVIAALLFVVMAAAALGGAALGRRLYADGRKAPSLSAIETGLFGLLGLLLAFTFSGAASRYETRGQLMTDAALAIRIAILRADLYPAAEREAIRRDLADYLAVRVAFHGAEGDDTKLAATIARSDALQMKLWSRVATLSRDPACATATGPMVNALERVFSLAGHRDLAARDHMPDAIVWVLFLLALATAFTSGYASGVAGTHSRIGYLGFALLTAVVVYVTMDLDRPGRGVIRRDRQQQAIEALQPMLPAPSASAAAG